MQVYMGSWLITATAGTKEGQPGYYVKTLDGVQWAPKDYFEGNHISLGDISHLPPHQQRVLGEQAALAVKISGLDDFIQSPAFLFIPSAEQHRLKIQLDAMRIYNDVLVGRIAAF